MGDVRTNPDYERMRYVYNKALNERLCLDDVAEISLHGKCQIIHDLVLALKDKLPQRILGTGRHTRESLLLIVKSFEPFDNLLGEQYRRKNILLKEVQCPKNFHILTTIRNWDSSSEEEKKNAIIQSCTLHKKTYLAGIAEVLPVEHIFKQTIATQRDKILLGGFHGDMATRQSKISYNTEYLDNVFEAFHTGHHESTHAIQFDLACAFHYNQIRRDHPLFDDARIFHAIEVNNASILFSVLKSSETQAYSEQMSERLAEDEGRLISHALIDLANR